MPQRPLRHTAPGDNCVEEQARENADPVARLAALMAHETVEFRAELVRESPAWSQLFVRRAPGTGDQSDTVVVTHDGASWAITMWPDADAFHSYQGDQVTGPIDEHYFPDRPGDAARALSAVREMLR